MSVARQTHLPHRGVAPALTGATGWLNEKPLTPADLRGHVVLYVFWTYTCVNWLRALPYIRAWDEKYRRHGLIVVGVHTPEFTFEQDADNVRTAVRSQHVGFPVVLDSRYDIWRSFDNHYWPALYLADDQGVIRYQHFGEGHYANTEQAIQQLLAVDDDLVVVTGRGVEAPADWDALESPETYLGYERAEGFASADGPRHNALHHYDVPARLPRNTWALSGEWAIHGDRVVAEQAGAGLAVRFHARDLNLVVTPATGRPVRFEVRLDGRPAGDARGLDVDDAGAGAVVEPRMYQLIRQRGPIVDRTAEITFPHGGVSAFVVTFG
jgi:thiol-disulfide isomerase/thioredoxin